MSPTKTNKQDGDKNNNKKKKKKNLVLPSAISFPFRGNSL